MTKTNMSDETIGFGDAPALHLHVWLLVTCCKRNFEFINVSCFLSHYRP